MEDPNQLGGTVLNMDFNCNMINFELHKEDEITGKQFIEVLRCSDADGVDISGTNPADFDPTTHLSGYDMPNHRYPNTYYDNSPCTPMSYNNHHHHQTSTNDLSPTTSDTTTSSYFSTHSSPFSPPPPTAADNNGHIIAVNEHFVTTYNGDINDLTGCGTPTPPPMCNTNLSNGGGAVKSVATRKKGGRKKNLRPPSPTVLKQRREAANARERKRMNGLNDAFERLREVHILLIF